jgi:hypothetical protein
VLYQYLKRKCCSSIVSVMDVDKDAQRPTEMTHDRAQSVFRTINDLVSQEHKSPEEGQVFDPLLDFISKKKEFYEVVGSLHGPSTKDFAETLKVLKEFSKTDELHPNDRRDDIKVEFQSPTSKMIKKLVEKSPYYGRHINHYEVKKVVSAGALLVSNIGEISPESERNHHELFILPGEIGVLIGVHVDHDREYDSGFTIVSGSEITQTLEQMKETYQKAIEELQKLVGEIDSDMGI